MSEQQQYEFNVELLDIITKLNKKVDKLTNIVTKMGKALHLIPVTEKEERELQLLQRTNMAQTAKIAKELAEMSPKEPSNTPEMLTIFDKYNTTELFSDVLGDDFLGGS
jgi:hypothetical protein